LFDKKSTSIVREPPSPFEGEFEKITSKQLGRCVGRNVEVEVRKVG
jgi:hypothetical protein